MKKKSLLTLLMGALLICSCETPRVVYFEDLDHGKTVQARDPLDISLRPGDKIRILVSTRDQQLSQLFNLFGSSNANAGGNSSGRMGYIIDSQGNIDFPILGTLHVAGLRREEVASKIKGDLIASNLVKEPVVTVDYSGLYFDVLGEVGRPGRYEFDRDRFTLLEGLSMAGDLTISGLRENVAVIRTEGNQRTTYRVNLQSGEELYKSPVYYLQQDDIIYVEPNKKRANQSTLNNTLLESPTFWMSVTTFLMSLSVFIFK